MPRPPIQAKPKPLRPKTLLDFARATFGGYQANWHHVLCAGYLERFVAGEIKRLMVFMPPRHGKSELVSRRLPAYIFARNPDARVIACSYGADLASRMNRDVQRILDGDVYRELYPDTRLYGASVRTVAQGTYLRNSDIFEIVGRGGYYRSAGVGGGITGMGFDYGIIDDPVKNREEAESKIYRDKVWDWYTSTFLTRAEKGAGILLTLTRWHGDDLAGRLLEQEAGDWTVLRLPALAEDGDHHPEDPRQSGDALWPQRFPQAELEAIRRVIGRDFYALYQQRPQPREGGLFKQQWLELVEEVPAAARRLRWWDKAATDGGGNYTAGVLLAEAGGVYYVEDVVRGQWSVGERDRVIRQTAARDRERYGLFPVWGPQDPGQAGKADAAAFARLLAGFEVHTEPETGSKETRARPLASQAEAGNVRVKRGPWSLAFIDELCSFPAGRFDDQVDGAANAFNKLARSGGGGFATSYVR